MDIRDFPFGIHLKIFGHLNQKEMMAVSHACQKFFYLMGDKTLLGRMKRVVERALDQHVQAPSPKSLWSRLQPSVIKIRWRQNCISAETKRTIQQKELELVKELDLDALIGGRLRSKELARVLLLFPKIYILDLSMNGLRAKGMDRISNFFISHGRLQSLNLRGNRLKKRGAKSLARSFDSLPNLEVLNLSCNGLKDKGLKAVAKKLRKLQQLKKLNLIGNWIGDHGVRKLARVLPKLPFIEDIDLSYNLIQDEGYLILKEIVPLIPSIQRIRLHNNSFSTEMVTLTPKSLESSH